MLNAPLSEAFLKYVHRCGSGEVLGELFTDFGQVLFYGLLDCLLPKIEFPPHWLLTCRKNTGIHKHDVMIIMSCRETHHSISDAKDVQSVVYPRAPDKRGY